MRIDIDNVHVYKDRKHKDCDWFDEDDFECTNWRDFRDPEDYAWLECFKENGGGGL